MNAYQSYLWNVVLTYREIVYPHQLLVGDYIEDANNAEIVQISSDAHLAAMLAEQYNTSHLVLPLFGSKVKLPANNIGRFYKSLLSSNGICVEGSGIGNSEDEPPVDSNLKSSKSLFPPGVYRKVYVSNFFNMFNASIILLIIVN